VVDAERVVGRRGRVAEIGLRRRALDPFPGQLVAGGGAVHALVLDDEDRLRRRSAAEARCRWAVVDRITRVADAIGVDVGLRRVRDSRTVVVGIAEPIPVTIYVGKPEA